MEVTPKEKFILKKVATKNLKIVYTHIGFVKNCDLTQEELETLKNLAHKMFALNYGIKIGDRLFTHNVSSSEDGIVIAGINIMRIVQLF